MKSKSGNVRCPYCNKTFGDDQRACTQHVKAKHSGKAKSYVDAVYTAVDELDLPDGAHFAMLEEFGVSTEDLAP